MFVDDDTPLTSVLTLVSIPMTSFLLTGAHLSPAPSKSGFWRSLCISSPTQRRRWLSLNLEMLCLIP